MRNINALTLFAILLLATSLDAFRLPYYARDDPYLQQILAPRKGAKGPDQYQIYMAREYLDEMEPYDQDPHDTVEEFLEPHFLWKSNYIFKKKEKYTSIRHQQTFLVFALNFWYIFFNDVNSQQQIPISILILKK